MRCGRGCQLIMLQPQWANSGKQGCEKRAGGVAQPVTRIFKLYFMINQLLQSYFTILSACLPSSRQIPATALVPKSKGKPHSYFLEAVGRVLGQRARPASLCAILMHHIQMRGRRANAGEALKRKECYEQLRQHHLQALLRLLQQPTQKITLKHRFAISHKNRLPLHHTNQLLPPPQKTNYPKLQSHKNGRNSPPFADSSDPQKRYCFRIKPCQWPEGLDLGRLRCYFGADPPDDFRLLGYDSHSQHYNRMAAVAKKFLVIMEINNLIFHLNNPRSKTVDHTLLKTAVDYSDSYKHLQVSNRKGKSELLNHLFIGLKQDIDVAVWSNLNNEYTNDLCHKYFTRYYRDLLFILATNRALYGDQPDHTPIKIRKDLTGIYHRFPAYNQGNTIVVTAQDNLMESHARNDLKVPEYSPHSPDFQQDPGLVPLAKYLSGLVLIKKESGIADIRRFVSAKEAKNIFKRASHNIFTDRTYI